MPRTPRVAYLCMEFGLDDRLQTFSGGLGILAGDTLKAAHDLDLPMVGVGIKWKQGYGTQKVDDKGEAYVAYRTFDYGDVLDDTGVEVTVEIMRESVQCKVWKTERFGNVPLYLLDTDLPGNAGSWLTGQLYGWFGEERVAQEIILGVGGVRALKALGHKVDLYHFNEGHALLAGFELLREEMDRGASFKDALKRVRRRIVFTTHTPVLQGNESHPIERLQYLGADLGLNRDELVQIGGEPFNMTVGALRLARNANAVAQLHGETANKMWEDVADRAEIIAITNGVHRGTWVDPFVDEALQGSDEDLWQAHQQNKHWLIDFIHARTGTRLHPERLLIGFARRAVTYKRANLLFEDVEQIRQLLEDGRLQLVFAGKFHPLDEGGKQITEEILHWATAYPKGVVFIPNYDIATGRALTRGCDVWLNNPRRPKEASGTSGMKAAMNGVLNLSIADGWWPEAADHGVNGWVIGDEHVPATEEEQDARDRAALYETLLEEVVPTYYDAPEQWRQMMRASITSTREQFSAARMVREYYDRLYTTGERVKARRKEEPVG
jgi:glycogen phosphorylase